MHLYRRMKETINYFQKGYLSEKKAKELIANKLSNAQNKLIRMEEENKQLQEYVHEVNKKYENINNKLSIYEIDKQKSVEQVYKLQEQNNHLRNSQHLYRERINNQVKELSTLKVLAEYYSSTKHDFKYEHRKYILIIVQKVLLLIKKLLVMGNQKVRRIKVVYEIKEQLAYYESCFYRNNFKLDPDARRILERINVYLEKWENFYKGYKWNARSVEISDVNYLEDLLEELHYLSLYKRFEKYNEKIVEVNVLYQILKNRRKLQSNYSLKRFNNEMKVLAKQKYIDLEKYIINRVFPGEIYTVLKSFNEIEYSFKMIKTYGMYHLLYVYGNKESNTVKVGVTKQNLTNRYMKAEESYNEHFSTHMLQEIKVIESLNALNLESYVKRKFKQQRHPLFNSTEWFLLTKSELGYFTNDEYKKDTDFMKILNYKLDV
ncbi:GIY-YIG nuclease family protein [Priestia aryabhattai]|uniref:GIY-YIG nuclease family protein n=1 Tax=Priestia aryabhattai TaxID=412384 RepID=UPI001C8DDD7A|nr:GIY-YIG nuclease family protein [Priestia aryabhattai]MBX9987161.1 GIY-YIG nuclease family protein [Priestia aryabhattai]